MEEIDSDFNSKLPIDLLMLIAENETMSVEDFVRFSCVCHSWRNAAYACDFTKLRSNWSRRRMPCLMLTDGNDKEAYRNIDDHEKCFEEGIVYPSDEEVSGIVDDGIYVDDDDDGAIANGDIPDIDRVRRDVEGGGGLVEGSSSNAIVENEEQNSWKDKENVIDEYYQSSIDLDCCQRRLLNMSCIRHSRSYNLNLPEMYGKACWGSPYGWVVTLGFNREMHLFNPLTKAQLPLPSQGKFPYSWGAANGLTIRNEFICKAVLLRLPASHVHTCNTVNDACACACDYDNGTWLVVTMYSESRLSAIAKPGDKAWTPLCSTFYKNDFISLQDVIYCHSMSSLLIVDSHANLFYSNLHDLEHPQKLKLYLDGPPSAVSSEVNNLRYSYVVESRGNYLVIIRNILISQPGYIDYDTTFIRVYKLDKSTKSWEEVHDLEGDALFLGSNVSMCVSSQKAGCRSNCIYFTDDVRVFYSSRGNVGGGHDMGVYSMDDRAFQPLYTGDHSRSSYCPPFWLSPMV